MTIRLLLADDQDMIRSAFRLILGSQPDMEIVAEVSDGTAAVEEARRLRPDVCLLDIRMPGIDGLEATRLLAGPDVQDPLNVLIATTFDLDEYVYSALRNGACGFLLKDGSPALLIEAVRAVSEKNALISPSITVRLLRHMSRTSGFPGTGVTPDERERQRTRLGAPPVRRAEAEDLLTPREAEVVRLVARGRTNVELAADLYVSLSTVKTHLASVQRKLRARNRVEVAAWAWEHGYCAAGADD
ncbi:DNA-binding NarL/FixJ family response regulator [Streptomyces sp. V3I8]|uniref:response regulator transcription factor n=1 Tax=Streptomyces sp. V3I8 TaxID=3042279 RepID=UPI002782DF98|nr:response regulator transcription factor [Streptomyces sp. V3I8]MDQ1041245.1 DNA-binding NarL/FixJ family response regulator [Streptomyces sp. V3I8]